MTEATEGKPFGDKVIDLLHKRWIQVLLVLGAVVLIIGGATYSKFNGIRHKGVDIETQLTAQYKDNQNELSTFISKFHEQVGIADRQVAQLDRVLSDAVKGRYDKDLTAAVPGVAPSGNLISALVEAYPQIDLSSYNRVLDTISSGREAYKNKQSALLDKLRAYDKWRNEDIIGSALISIGGFPSHNLRASVGDQVFYGQAALDKMYNIVLTQDAVDAYQSGTLDPLSADPPSSGG